MNHPNPGSAEVGKNSLITMPLLPVEPFSHTHTHTYIRFPALGWPGEDVCRLLLRRPSL